MYINCLNKKQQWVIGLEENMFIDVNNIIWAWSPRERWTRDKIKINKKGLAIVKVQLKQMEYNVQSGSDADMDRS